MEETQGQRIKKIRQALELSQEEFGNIFDVTKQYIYSLEKDKVVINNEKIVKLVVDYNINANYLLCGVGEMFIGNNQKYSDFREEILHDVRKMLQQEGVIK